MRDTDPTEPSAVTGNATGRGPGNAAGIGRVEASAREELGLKDAAHFLVEECRMVLPGIQALFGFQLVAVFNSEFARKLSPAEQLTHLVATGLIALAIGLIMAPAAWHRQTTPRAITSKFIRICTRLLLWAMAPLSLGLCIDFYLLVVAVTARPWAAAIAAALFGYFVVLWFVFPRCCKP